MSNPKAVCPQSSAPIACNAESKSESSTTAAGSMESKSQIGYYYVAIKSVSNDEYILLPLMSFTPALMPHIVMSPADPRLRLMEGHANKKVGIIAYESEQNIRAAFVHFKDTVTNLADILRLAKFIGHKYIRDIALQFATKELIKYKFASPIKIEQDVVTIAFKSRKWPVSIYSSDAWKQMCIDPTNADVNWMIGVAKKIITKCTAGEAVADYTPSASGKNVELIKQLQPISGEDMPTFASRVRQIANLKRYTQDFLEWVIAESSNIPKKVEGVLFKYIIVAVTNDVQYVRTLTPGIKVRPTILSSATNMTWAADVIEQLMAIGDENNFMFFYCSLLRSPSYIRLAHNSKMMQYMTKIMTKREIFIPMVKNAISYVIYYMTRVEFGSESGKSLIDDEYVLTMDAMAAFPVFDDVTPYIPVGIKYLKFNIPWRLDGARTPVAPENISARITTTMVDETRTTFKMLEDIPWHQMKLILTGSRYAGCCWIDQRERDYGDLKPYIVDHIGTSQLEIDAMITAYHLIRTDQPCLDAATFPEGKAADQFAIIQTILTELKAGPLHLRRTDIDIATYCPINQYDECVARLVKHMRTFGTVFAVRTEKYRGYSWTVVASFLRYTIDLFHSEVSPINLISRYMTCYSRAYFDGTVHIGTADYLCSRMSGVNYRYIYTMRDPICIMVKCALREGITMLINVREQTMLTAWVAKHMAGIPITYGNVSPHHPFYGNGNVVATENKSDAKNMNINSNETIATAAMPWISRDIISPTGRPLPVWNYPKAMLCEPESSDFIEYISYIIGPRD